ncbi:hypothetical protein X798_03935 [Onchocerca flexuosa]|uniref:Uncharacterized protein n=1 Tax=Onchocerca flexuosa TaxID=387005 RepID=A0A238BWA2_9BILA|nr:hypothetical protein X798_03935 [Onchocerca flexuosa]
MKFNVQLLIKSIHYSDRHLSRSRNFREFHFWSKKEIKEISSIKAISFLDKIRLRKSSETEFLIFFKN